MAALIVGDIHGCYDELQALLDASGISDDDTIISIGDLLDKGSNPLAVLRFFQDTPNATSLLGNHDQKHLRVMRGEIKPRIPQLITHWRLGKSYPDALALFAALPLFIDLPDALLVHAFYEPTIPLDQQQTRVLVGTPGAEEYLKKTYERPWYDLYDGDKPIIVGHRDYSSMEKPFIIDGRVYGLDTRCVYGGAMTGLVVPDWRFVRVPAKRNYWEKVLSQHKGE